MFAVTILGSNSALPMHNRHPTSQVVQFGEYHFLVDCGEGTQMQMNRFKIRRNRIRHIFISHLHGDHYFGLPGLLAGYGLNGRTDELWVYSPPMLKEIIEIQFAPSDTILPYPLHFVPIEKEGILLEEPSIRVKCFPVSHSVPCWGFLFEEKEKQPKLNMEQLAHYQIPATEFRRLKAGDDFVTPEGKIIPNKELTIAPDTPRSYAFCADTLYDETIASHCRDVTLLYHEATYLQANQEKAKRHMHSTTQEAAAIAKKANAGRLIIGHFSSRYETLDEMVEEAREIFPNTDLALEGVTYLV